MPAIMRFCLSTSQLNDYSASVTLTTVFIDSVIKIKFKQANSPPISFNNFSGAPYVCSHDLKIALRKTSNSLYLAKVDNDSLVRGSIKCSKILPLSSFKSITIHSWTDVAIWRPTTGLCSVFDMFYRFHIHHWLF